MRTYTDYPMQERLILGFCTYPTEYLEYIKRDFGLLMPIETLSYIQNHYRLIEKRDCDVSELVLLDILLANLNEELRSRRDFSIAEMVTDSDEIRESFEDMMTKLSLIEKKTQCPISLERLMNVSSDYIASIFPERGSEHYEAKHIGEKEPELLSLLEGSREAVLCDADQIKFSLSSASVKNAIKEGVYILIKNNGELAAFIDELHENDIPFSGWSIYDGLIATVLSDTVSAEITVPGAIPEMATYGRGDILLLCAEKDEMDVVRLGMERGLQMRRAGRKNKNGKLLFKSRFMTTAIDGNFVGNFVSAKAVSPIGIRVGENALSGNMNCRLKKVSCDRSIGELSAVCAFSDMQAPYMSGIGQVLCAAAGEIALGASIEDIKLKTDISCPKDTDPARIFAHILGIYRAEIELCLSSRNNRLHVSDGVDDISSVSIALANAKGCGSFGAGKLFAVSPEEKDGRICFANVRKTFSYVSALIESGHVIRACALDSDGLKDSTEENKNISAGSFLILTDAELCGCDGVFVKNIGVVGMENAFPIV